MLRSSDGVQILVTVEAQTGAWAPRILLHMTANYCQLDEHRTTLLMEELQEAVRLVRELTPELEDQEAAEPDPTDP